MRRPQTTRTRPGRGCSIATSRSASAGGMRPARRAAATTASWAITTPMPSAATSGTSECAGANAGPTSPRSARTSTMRFASGRPATSPSAPATSDTSSASPAISRRICARRRAERAQHRGLPAALGDRERERPGDHEQRDRTGDPAQRAEDGDQPRAVRRGRVAGVGVGGVPRDRGPRSRARGAPPGGRAARPADVPGSAITPTALTRPGAPDSAAATAGGKNTAAWLSSPAPRASARPLTR